MADFVVVYNVNDGFVVKIFPRTSSDNVATWKADGKLTVDGEDVVLGINDEGSEFAAILLEDVADADASAPPGVYELDDLEEPATVGERTDGGRDKYWPYEP